MALTGVTQPVIGRGDAGRSSNAAAWTTNPGDRVVGGGGFDTADLEEGDHLRSAEETFCFGE